MSSPDDRTLQVRASAAAWLARLRSTGRTSQDEAAFQEWLAADSAHAAAFEVMNTVWDASRPLSPEMRVPHDLPGKVVATGRRISRRAVFGGAAVAAGLGGTLLFAETAAANVYQTEIGEQKHVLLRDGSELFLDTNTRVSIHFDGKSRNAVLDYGCTNFRLAADSARPFSVHVGDDRVICNRSVLDVRRDGDMASVVLLQGHATVESGVPGFAPSRALNSGERLITTKNSVTVDRPDLVPLMAWQTGQAIFRNETLGQAAYEMNRYSKLRLEIKDPRIEQMKVSGVYHVGDNLVFALALEALLPVQIRPFGDRIEVVGNDKNSQRT